MKTTYNIAQFIVIFLCGLAAATPVDAASEKMPPITLEAKAPIESFEAAKSGALPADVQPEAVDIESTPMIPPPGTPVFRAPEKEEKETTDPDGRRTVENFEDGLRTQMRKFDPGNNLTESWTFDKANHGRILRYAKYEYGKDGLEKYRAAEWTYDAAGGASKLSKLYDGKNRQTGFFVEYLTESGGKYCEQWFDAKGKLTSQKIWDRDTGDFKEHVIVKPYLTTRKIQWLDERKNKIREVVVPAGRGVLGMIGFGKQYATGFEKMRESTSESRRTALANLV